MKRKDAFRKLRTICQRLDEANPNTFFVVPRRLYLFGSVLTDKLDPTDIDLIFVYDRSPHLNLGAEVMAMSYGRPMAHNKASTHLRRGMKMVQLYMAEFGLDQWDQRALLLFVQPRLIWQPGGDWQTALTTIENSPTPWDGPRPENSQEVNDAYLDSLPYPEFEAKLAQALTKIETQEI